MHGQWVKHLMENSLPCRNGVSGSSFNRVKLAMSNHIGFLDSIAVT